MVSCCVPHCPSKQGRNKEVSFHEFPVNSDAKDRWVDNIVKESRCRRTALERISTERNKVCSRHFVVTDFSMSTTKRRLLPHAVPSLFPDHSQSDGKHTPLVSPVMAPTQQSSCRVVQPEKISHSGCPVIVAVSSKRRQLPDGHSVCENRLPVAPKRLRLVESEVTNRIGSRVAQVAVVRSGSLPSSISFQHVGVQVDCRTARQTCPDKIIKMYKSKFRSCKRRVYRLQRRVAMLKERQAELCKERLNAAQHQKVDAIVRSAKEGSRRANFLLEQINAFGQTKPRWQQHTVRLCTAWQQRYPKGYRFVRNANIMNLPHQATLKRFEDNAVRFEDAAPVPSPHASDHQVALTIAGNTTTTETIEELPTTLLVTEEETGDEGFCPSSDATMLARHVGELFQHGTTMSPQPVDEALDAGAGDQVLIEGVPLSLLQSGPMAELSLANQELIRNFLLVHQQNGGVIELDDHGNSCLTLCDDQTGVIEQHHMSTDGDLESSPHDTEPSGEDTAYPDKLTLAAVNLCLVKEEFVIVRTELPDADDLLPNAGDVFANDDTIMELQ